MKTKILIGLLIVGIVLISGCVKDSETQYPPIESGKGRVIFDLKVVPEEITTREIVDEFLIGVGTTDFKSGCVTSAALRDLRINGINYFLPFTHWESIEREKGHYRKDPCPGEDTITWLDKTGATMNGHCLIFFINFSVPSFAADYSFSEQKEMIEKYVKATVKNFPEIEIWTLNEPIAQNCLGWSREQAYDVFVSASRWIHEVDPEAKVMINMIPIECDWGGLDYEPNEVLDDLIDGGLEADIIGIELYHWWAEEEVDENGYPKLDWVKSRVDLFRKYNLPIIFSEVAVPGIMKGKEQWNEQADWMEVLFRFFHDDGDIIGSVWYFVRDDKAFMPYAGLMNDDTHRPVAERLIELANEWNLPYAGLMNDDCYTHRPVAERLIELANEWNPSTTHNLNGQNYLNLDPGEYDVIVNQEVFRVNIIEGQTVKITPREVITESPEVLEEADLVVRVGGNGIYPSIQEAIDSARNGSNILVSQGTYLETITITAPKTLTIQGGWNQGFTSRSNDSSLTVIDGRGDDSVIGIGAGRGVAITLTIEGFTIQNGEADYGGGISIASGDSLDLNLINNNISGNTANKEGGGISIVSVGGSINATLINNIISGNIATGEGGGIHVNSASAGSAEVTLTGNIITDNMVTNPFEEPPSDGGGIAAYASDSDAVTKLQLTNNIITKNEAGGGGGIWTYAWGPNAILTMVLTNNIIAGNKAVHGAGIFFHSGAGCPITKPGGSVICNLTNNIITGNIASVGDSGIIIMSGSTYGDGGIINLSMQNDIIWGNADPRGGEQLVVIVAEGRSGVATATASYSDIGLIKSYHGGSYTPDNVIDADPLFVDPANQVFLLQDGSPCVDAGDPGSVYNDGCRPPARGTERNDMGAYGGPNNCHWP